MPRTVKVSTFVIDIDVDTDLPKATGNRLQDASSVSGLDASSTKAPSEKQHDASSSKTSSSKRSDGKQRSDRSARDKEKWMAAYIQATQGRLYDGVTPHDQHIDNLFVAMNPTPKPRRKKVDPNGARVDPAQVANRAVPSKAAGKAAATDARPPVEPSSWGTTVEKATRKHTILNFRAIWDGFDKKICQITHHGDRRAPDGGSATHIGESLEVNATDSILHQ